MLLLTTTAADSFGSVNSRIRIEGLARLRRLEAVLRPCTRRRDRAWQAKGAAEALSDAIADIRVRLRRRHLEIDAIKLGELTFQELEYSAS